MKVRKSQQTHDSRRSIEGLELRHRLALRLALKHTNIKQIIGYMTGRVAKQHRDYYFDLALQDSKEGE
jgi:hypothetical protein